MPRPGWLVTSLTVGVREQMDFPGPGVPAEIFWPGAVGVRIDLEIIAPGQRVTLKMRNTSKETRSIMRLTGRELSQ